MHLTDEQMSYLLMSKVGYKTTAEIDPITDLLVERGLCYRETRWRRDVECNTGLILISEAGKAYLEELDNAKQEQKKQCVFNILNLSIALIALLASLFPNMVNRCQDAIFNLFEMLLGA